MKKFIFIFLVVLVSCSPKVRQVNTFKYNKYVPEDSDLVQTQNGLTVEIIPLSPDVTYEYPELFSFEVSDMPSDWQSTIRLSYPEINNKRWQYTFGMGDKYLTAFEIKITNKTGHILRMKDSRMYLRIEGRDPVKAITKLGDSRLKETNIGTQENPNYYLLPRSYINADNSIIDWVTQYANDFNQKRSKSLLSLKFWVGTLSQVINANQRNYKLINNVGVEILPDDTYSGILVFPAVVSYSNVGLYLYDFITKTDNAGNPTEKTTFEFNFAKKKSMQWYDRNQEMWKIGTPEYKTEWHDKEQGKWILGKPSE